MVVPRETTEPSVYDFGSTWNSPWCKRSAVAFDRQIFHAKDVIHPGLERFAVKKATQAFHGETYLPRPACGPQPDAGRPTVGLSKSEGFAETQVELETG